MPLSSYPTELLSVICAYIYAAGLPPPLSPLDPPLSGEFNVAPISLPSAFPPGSWPEPVARRTLAHLCLVNHAWNSAAKPWLWRRVEIRLPRSWISFVEEVAGDEDDELNAEQAALDIGKSIKDAAQAAMSVFAAGPPDNETALRLQERLIARLSGPDAGIPPELLSPCSSRESSPKRLRTKSRSPARWTLMRSINNALLSVIEHKEPGIYVPAPEDPRPGHLVLSLDFNHFRTIGMRRSIEESVNSRFVTANRVVAVLREMPNLLAFGGSDYVDGALTLAVLKELFLRGVSSRTRGRPSRGRGLVTLDSDSDDEQERGRREDCKELQAIDLTGCVSAVFVDALTQFVTTQLLHISAEEQSSLSRNPHDEPLTFPGLQRLGLRGVKSIQPSILSPFVLSFPSLTHLDLSGTRVTPELLSSLGASSSVRLYSLSLARCISLTGESITTFLISSSVTAGLRELNLYGDMTFRSPLSEQDLSDMFSLAPCFKSGKLVYLDLSSAPVTKEHLSELLPPHPHLRSLGLSFIPDLPLDAVADFLRAKAPNVEVITLIFTSPDLECGIRAGMGPDVVRGSVRKASIALHTQLIRPLCTPPFSFSVTAPAATHAAAPIRLRVVELSMLLLGGLGAGAGAWRIVRSKGGRGWYVDTASGWVSGDLRRDLASDHPLRVEMESLAIANGNVSSGVGWHARKMEILHGTGMLGREDGLYGAVSFAYQG